MSDATATPVSVTRDELYELVWTEPMTKVAPRFGLSDVGLAKLCKRYDIPRPPVGYWAQKEFGKQPERTPLPPAAEHSRQTIEFAAIEENEKLAPMRTAADRVSDEQLKKLIQFEKQPENRIVVSDNPAKRHPIIRAAKLSTKETNWHRQGLYSPSWPEGGPWLAIEVGKESLPRALWLMDALLKAFESRGHKVVAETKEHRRKAIFVIMGEQFSFRLREKTKMVHVPESERKGLFANKVRYEPTGNLELQLQRMQWGDAQATWKDGKYAKLEDQLNDVMIELIVAVEAERQWRQRQEESERQRRTEAEKRWQQEQERRQEEKKLNELLQMLQNWDQAARIREFMADVRSTIERRQGQIAEGSDLARWIDWALKHAERLDPLREFRTSDSISAIANDWSRPNQPR